jgi:hypothetical protein
MWLNIGGRAGHGRLWDLRIEEGLADEHGEGRRWDVTVTSATEARQAEGETRRQAKQQEAAAKSRADDDAVMAGLDRLDTHGKGVTRKDVRAQPQQVGRPPFGGLGDQLDNLGGRGAHGDAALAIVPLSSRAVFSAPLGKS